MFVLHVVISGRGKASSHSVACYNDHIHSQISLVGSRATILARGKASADVRLTMDGGMLQTETRHEIAREDRDIIFFAQQDPLDKLAMRRADLPTHRMGGR